VNQPFSTRIRFAFRWISRGIGTRRLAFPCRCAGAASRFDSGILQGHRPAGAGSCVLQYRTEKRYFCRLCHNGGADGTSNAATRARGSRRRRPEQPGESREPLWRLLRVDESLYRGYAQTAGTLAADIRFSVSRYLVVGRLPVRQAAKFKKQSDYFLITICCAIPMAPVAVREGRMELKFPS
jgi:hypothetical protein